MGLSSSFLLCGDFCQGIMFFERVARKVEAARSEERESDVFVQSGVREKEEEWRRRAEGKNFDELHGGETGEKKTLRD